ncbi:hypothetical protein HOH45_05005 [bacterium]|nr:hypothetical protein [bacterium]
MDDGVYLFITYRVGAAAVGDLDDLISSLAVFLYGLTTVSVFLTKINIIPSILIFLLTLWVVQRFNFGLIGSITPSLFNPWGLPIS